MHTCTIDSRRMNLNTRYISTFTRILAYTANSHILCIYIYILLIRAYIIIYIFITYTYAHTHIYYRNNISHNINIHIYIYYILLYKYTYGRIIHSRVGIACPRNGIETEGVVRSHSSLESLLTCVAMVQNHFPSGND